MQRKSSDDIFAYMLCLLIYVPSSTTGNMIRVAIAGALFLLKIKTATENSIGKISVCMLVSPFIPVLIVLLLERSIDIPSVTHEIMRMTFCAFIVMTVSRFHISFRCLYICCVIALIPNFIIQILQYNDVESAFTFVRENYVDASMMDEWTHLELARIEGGGFRSGSVFINPNVYMVIPLLSTVIFCKADSRSPNILNYLLIGCAMASCFLTGSRTATVVLAVILGIYLFRYSSGRSRLVFAAGLIAVVVFFGTSVLSEARSLTFSKESSDSLEVKFKSFYYFWVSTLGYPVYWITGSLGSNVAAGTDSEFGHIYSWFGVFGLFWYVNYLRLVFMRNRDISYFSKPISYVCLLVALTASVLLCMPIYSFVCLLQFASVRFEEQYELGEVEV